MAHDKEERSRVLLSFSLLIYTYNSPSLYRNIVQPHLRQVQMGLSLYV